MDVYASMDYVFSCVESEPRDAGTDQRSSGIIRLHTIKQIIDRVSSLTHLTHAKLFKAHSAMQELSEWHYCLLLVDCGTTHFLETRSLECFCMFSAGQACSVRHYS